MNEGKIIEVNAEGRRAALDEDEAAAAAAGDARILSIQAIVNAKNQRQTKRKRKTSSADATHCATGDADSPPTDLRANTAAGGAAARSAASLARAAHEGDGSNDDGDTRCAICLSEPEDATLPERCAHIFCYVCILQWALINTR